MANTNVLSGTFTGVGQSASFTFLGIANVSIGINSATVELQKSYDGGTTWSVVSKNVDGDDASYTTSFEGQLEETEGGIQYRFNCSAFTSGPVTYRMSS